MAAPFGQTTISELPAAAALTGMELFPVSSPNGVLKKRSLNQWRRRGAWCVNLLDYAYLVDQYGWTNPLRAAYAETQTVRKPLYIPGRSAPYEVFNPGDSQQRYILSCPDIGYVNIQGDGPGHTVIQSENVLNMGLINVQLYNEFNRVVGVTIDVNFTLGFSRTGVFAMRTLSGLYLLWRDVEVIDVPSYGLGMEATESFTQGYKDVLVQRVRVRGSQQDGIDTKNRLSNNRAFHFEDIEIFNHSRGSGIDDAGIDCRGYVIVNGLFVKMDNQQGGVGFRFRETGTGSAGGGGNKSILANYICDMGGVAVPGQLCTGLQLAGNNILVKDFTIHNPSVKGQKNGGQGVQINSTATGAMLSRGIIEDCGTGIMQTAPGSTIHDVTVRNCGVDAYRLWGSNISSTEVDAIDCIGSTWTTDVQGRTDVLVGIRRQVIGTGMGPTPQLSKPVFDYDADQVVTITGASYSPNNGQVNQTIQMDTAGANRTFTFPSGGQKGRWCLVVKVNSGNAITIRDSQIVTLTILTNAGESAYFEDDGLNFVQRLMQ